MFFYADINHQLSLNQSIYQSNAGAVVRVFTSHQCDPVSIPAQRHVWVEFNVHSRLAPRFFSGLPGFP